MAFRDNQATKRKASSNEECYNCHRIGHFGCDCSLPDRRLNRNTNPPSRNQSREGSAPRQRGRSSNPNRVHQAAEQEEDSDPEPFAPGPVGKACMAVESLQNLQKTTSNTWFLDSCASRHLCNNRKLFRSTHAKSLDFVTAAGQVIRTNKRNRYYRHSTIRRQNNRAPQRSLRTRVRFVSDFPRPTTQKWDIAPR